MAKLLCVSSCLVLVLAGSASAQLNSAALTMDADPRVITNFTSILPTDILSSLSNLTTIGIGVAVFGVGAVVLAGAIAISVYFISNQISPLSSILGTSRSSNYHHYRTTRDTSSYNYDLLTFLSVTSDLYERLNHYDEECRKQIICKTMEDPEIFGNSANKVKYGLTFASSFLDYWGIPYVADIAEAATLDSQDFRSCEERFPSCDEEVSLKDTFMRSMEKVREENVLREEMQAIRNIEARHLYG